MSEERTSTFIVADLIRWAEVNEFASKVMDPHWEYRRHGICITAESIFPSANHVLQNGFRFPSTVMTDFQRALYFACISRYVGPDPTSTSAFDRVRDYIAGQWGDFTPRTVQNFLGDVKRRRNMTDRTVEALALETAIDYITDPKEKVTESKPTNFELLAEAKSHAICYLRGLAVEGIPTVRLHQLENLCSENYQTIRPQTLALALEGDGILEPCPFVPRDTGSSFSDTMYNSIFRSAPTQWRILPKVLSSSGQKWLASDHKSVESAPTAHTSTTAEFPSPFTVPSPSVQYVSSPNSENEIRVSTLTVIELLQHLRAFSESYVTLSNEITSTSDWLEKKELYIHRDLEIYNAFRMLRSVNGMEELRDLSINRYGLDLNASTCERFRNDLVTTSKGALTLNAAENLEITDAISRLKKAVSDSTSFPSETMTKTESSSKSQVKSASAPRTKAVQKQEREERETKILKAIEQLVAPAGNDLRAKATLAKAITIRQLAEMTLIPKSTITDTDAYSKYLKRLCANVQNQPTKQVKPAKAIKYKNASCNS